MNNSGKDTTPRIYVASLSDYNAGRLHGRWIDASQDAEAIRAEIQAMLAESPEPIAEEWAIHDYENFAGFSVHEFADIDFVAEVAKLLQEHGPVFAGLLSHFAGDLEEAKAYMEDGYRGEWDDLGWFAADFIGDLYHHVLKDLPDLIRNNIDWDAIGRDLQLGGDIITIEIGGKVHVFDSCL